MNASIQRELWINVQLPTSLYTPSHCIFAHVSIKVNVFIQKN